MKYLFEYRRVSSNKQLSGSGMELQRLTDETRHRLCEEHGLSPYHEVFDDAGVSGFSIDDLLQPDWTLH
ncbi:hypothetical protein L1D55_23080 [Vibrio sp. Isolate22]|uniref:hypothetical protein n=1 Tax=Vibrio sp. Isolate22 TaxID=2908532 RepID=UPI001EFC6D0F|nr:hypothetical protein [Vibrio sp. Isolate22]MCG9694580.1 hypothetical protein [Vibrio sp. Isolate22]